MKTRERKDPNVRRASILLAAVELAKKKGYSHITRKEIAERAGVAATLVTWYFKDMDALKAEIMREAIRLELHTILLQGLAAKDPIADRAPKALINKAVAKYS